MLTEAFFFFFNSDNKEAQCVGPYLKKRMTVVKLGERGKCER